MPTETPHSAITMAEAEGKEEQERAVGITAFVSPSLQGFTCTIKHRYTDFLVNEILSNGTVLHLTNDSVSTRQRDGNDLNGQRNEEVGTATTSQSGNGASGVKRAHPEDQEEVNNGEE